MPLSPYIHGKFYVFDNDCTEPCIPYGEILPRVRALGYQGYIAAEYEGHHFDLSLDAQEQLRSFVTMFERYLDTPRRTGR